MDALGDPTRRAIIDRLLGGPMPVGELARDFPISRPAISQHLRILKERASASSTAPWATDGSTRWIRTASPNCARTSIGSGLTRLLLSRKRRNSAPQGGAMTSVTEAVVRKTITVSASP